MSDIKINEQTYSGVDTIVVKTPSGATTKFTEGERPAGTINITTNGTHDVTNYASASVNVPTGGGGESGEDVTEWVKRDVVGTWEAKNFTTDDGTTYETIKIDFMDYGNNGDDAKRYVDVYLDGTEKPLFYIVEGTKISFMLRNSESDVISSLTYSGETGTLVADDSKQLFRKLQITTSALSGYWTSTTPTIGNYYVFKDNYTVEHFIDWEIHETCQFYIDRNFVYVDYGNDGSYYEYEYKPDGKLYAGGSPWFYRINSVGTLDISEEGTHFVIPYEKVNVQIDYETILNTEV